jgi:hypothetical protein
LLLGLMLRLSLLSICCLLFGGCFLFRSGGLFSC